MSEWPLVALGQIAKVRRQLVNPAALAVSYADHFSIPAYDTGSPDRVAPVQIKSHKQAVYTGDVLLSLLNPHIPRVWAPRVDPNIPALASTEFLVLESAERVAPGFLKYWLQSPVFQRALRSSVTGTSGSHQRVRPGDALRLCAPIPPLPTQRAISDVLGALDDKIEANERLIRAGEELLRALFEQCSRVETGTPVSLGEICRNVRRTVDPGELEPSTPYMGLEHMPRGSVILRERGVAGEVSSGKSAFQVHDILFGKLRPYFRKVAITATAGVCSSDILVLRVPDQEFFAFVLMVVSSQPFIDYCSAVSSGTRMPRVSWNDMARYQVRLPVLSVLNRFNRLAVPLLDRMTCAAAESSALAALRDALLPPLLSGELTVRDAESVVTETV